MPESEATLENVQPQLVPKPRDRRALSALRHGLTGQVHIITPADQAAYDKHCQGYHESLAPALPIEVDLVQSIADDRWRMKRASAIENCIFAEGIALTDDAVSGHPEIDAALAQAAVWLQKSGSLQLLALYESRIQRRFERNMAELRTLQTERKDALQQAVEKAALILDFADNKGASFDVETEFPDGAIPAKFVFSLAQIKSLATFERCVIAAKRHSAAPFKPRRMAA
jgi:hypothetical protein